MTTSPPTSDRAEARTGPIVVGVDGSEGSIAALQWAATEARAQGRPLTVIHVVASLASSGFPLAPVPGMDEALMAGAESTLDNALAAAFGDERPAGIRREVARGHPARVLIEAARDASLLVVGARGHGVFSLGSVSDRCVHHAVCPVAVVRDRGLGVLTTPAGSAGVSTDLPAAGHGSPPPGWIPGSGAGFPTDTRW
jgi:nucleotide-binding universal stress UspA family protein